MIKVQVKYSFYTPFMFEHLVTNKHQRSYCPFYSQMCLQLSRSLIYYLQGHLGIDLQLERCSFKKGRPGIYVQHSMCMH